MKLGPWLTAAVVASSLVFAGPSAAVAVDCPAPQTFAQAGTIGQVPDAPVAGVGISGMAVSRFNSTVDGAQLAWAIADRTANELAGPDTVFLFGLDARDGSLAVRYPLDPASFQDDPKVAGTDTITTTAQTANPIPDMEEISLRYVPGGPGEIWIFDTGDNSNSRGNVNLYALPEPDLTSVLATDPELDDAVTGAQLSPSRYRVKLMVGTNRVSANVEAGFVDSTAPDAPIYLIAKGPRDLDGEGKLMKDDFRVFVVSTKNAVTPDTPTATNLATAKGYVEFDQPTLRVTGASMLDDGSQLVIRAVSAKPDVDLEALYYRGDPTSDVSAIFAADPHPMCTLSLNSAPRSMQEEMIAYRLTPGAASGFGGFAWSHDAPVSAGPQGFYVSS